jgi:ABC-type arginine transport system permease subunit
VPATLYTTLIRSVPDLVLILLIFYSLQLWLNDLTEVFGWDYFEIDPFGAGVSPWALSTARISPRTSAARSSACRPASWKPPPPMA